jgi:Gluconate 2-dehydrogenase subunit 3
MQRRDVLRLLATGTALHLAPRSLLVTLAQARTAIASETTLRTLDAHQAATVTKMTELILPRTETPGAADVGATEFIDLLLTEWYEQPERTLFADGLADVDSRSKALFANNFIDCSALQQADILAALGDNMIEATAKIHAPWADNPSETNFYAMLRRLTLSAYYTSEKGATEELHFEIIPGSYEGCHTVTPSKGVSEQE